MTPKICGIPHGTRQKVVLQNHGWWHTRARARVWVAPTRARAYVWHPRARVYARIRGTRARAYGSHPRARAYARIRGTPARACARARIRARRARGTFIPGRSLVAGGRLDLGWTSPPPLQGSVAIALIDDRPVFCRSNFSEISRIDLIMPKHTFSLSKSKVFMKIESLEIRDFFWRPSKEHECRWKSPDSESIFRQHRISADSRPPNFRMLKSLL